MCPVRKIGSACDSISSTFFRIKAGSSFVPERYGPAINIIIALLEAVFTQSPLNVTLNEEPKSRFPEIYPIYASHRDEAPRSARMKRRAPSRHYPASAGMRRPHKRWYFGLVLRRDGLPPPSADTPQYVQSKPRMHHLRIRRRKEKLK